METLKILQTPLSKIVEDHPLVADFLTSFGIEHQDNESSFSQVIDNFPEEYWETNGTDKQELTGVFVDFINGMEHANPVQKIETLEVIAGCDKHHNPEPCN